MSDVDWGANKWEPAAGVGGGGGGGGQRGHPHDGHRWEMQGQTGRKLLKE